MRPAFVEGTGGAGLRVTRDGQGRCLRPIAEAALEARWHCALPDIKGRVLIGDAVCRRALLPALLEIDPLWGEPCGHGAVWKRSIREAWLRE